MSTPISRTFDALRQQGRMAFIPFIAAGDPDLLGTRDLVTTLSESGADLIEIGFPYSDPIADGPVIQASYTRALDKKIKLGQIFTTIRELANEIDTPLVGMVSYAIVFRLGPKNFVEASKDAGLAGLIVPDLPGDEAQEFGDLVRAAGMDLIPLVAPTTPEARVEKILASASGFIYCIAVAGTTGVREVLTTDLHQQLAMLKGKTNLPLCVGFGIGRPEQITELRGRADGAIVGSAVVRLLTDDRGASLNSVSTFAKSLAEAAHQTGTGAR